MKKNLSVVLIFLAIMIAIFAGISLISNVKATVVFKGPGMEPTIKSGQHLKLQPYLKGQLPKRGDIVEYTAAGNLIKQYNSSGKLIDRIVALPGERITISDGHLLVYNLANPSGFDPDSSYLSPKAYTIGKVDVTLGPDSYYILGDNRSDLLDSRMVGPIKLKDILGKVTI